MTLDDLEIAIRGCSPARDVQGLADVIAAWKVSPEAVDDLRYLVDKYIGNVWLDEAVHDEVYGLWSTFATQQIDAIQGMTVNERLFAFSLLNAFDVATDPQKLVIRSKVQANP